MATTNEIWSSRWLPSNGSWGPDFALGREALIELLDAIGSVAIGARRRGCRRSDVGIPECDTGEHQGAGGNVCLCHRVLWVRASS